MLLAIVDTSSILFGFSNRRDVFAAVSERFPGAGMLISAGVLAELAGISENRGKRGTSARTALEAIKHKKILVDKDTGNVDAWIRSKSLESKHSVVITNDTELLRVLRSSGVMCLKLTRQGLLR